MKRSTWTCLSIKYKAPVHQAGSLKTWFVMIGVKDLELNQTEHLRDAFLSDISPWPY